MQQIGHVLFISGIILAFFAGLGADQPWIPVGLALLGIFVGLVNVTVTDTMRFLVTGIALEVSASAFREFDYIGVAMEDVMIFVGGALLVVAVRVLFASALTNLWVTESQESRENQG